VTTARKRLLLLDDPAESGLGTPALRAAAEAAYTRAELPDRRTEDWKYTGVGALSGVHWATPTAASAQALTAADLASWAVAGVPRLVLVDGIFAPALSDALAIPGLSVNPLADRMAPEGFGTLLDIEGHAFAALNAWRAADGVTLEVARGAQAGAVHVLQVYSAGNTPRLVCPRVFVSVADGGQLEVIEQHVSLDASKQLVASVTELIVGTNASLQHTRIGDEGAGTRHYGRVQVAVARDGRYAHRGVMLGGAQARCELHLRFDEPGAEAEIDAIFAAQAGRHLDLHTVVTHAAHHCTSRQLCKGIATAGGRGVFTGLVKVGVGAHHTRADQSNPNLLLGAATAEGGLEAGRIDTRPQLEIDNDDVKCSHGATVGRLDADALFYLSARGLPRATAERLLTAAFAHEVLAQVPQADLRARLTASVLGALYGAGEGADFAGDFGEADDETGAQ
jgi:Fe-S cluster assembly protein SufD